MTTFVSQMKGLRLSSIGSWLRNTTNASRIALRREMPHSITGARRRRAGRDKPCPYNVVAKCSIVEKIVGAGLVPARPAPSGAGKPPEEDTIPYSYRRAIIGSTLVASLAGK